MDRVAVRQALGPYGWSRASRALYATPAPVAAPIRQPASAAPYPARWAKFTERACRAPVLPPPVRSAQLAPEAAGQPVTPGIRWRTRFGLQARPAGRLALPAAPDAVPGRSAYARRLHIHTLALPGWQRFLLLEGAGATAAVLTLGELASVWVLAVLPAVCAVAVKVFDEISAALPGPGFNPRPPRFGEHGHVRAWSPNVPEKLPRVGAPSGD